MKLKAILLFNLLLSLGLGLTSTLAHSSEDGGGSTLHRDDPSAILSSHDASMANIISSGPFAKVVKNLEVAGTGSRPVSGATTDVWAHDGYAYTGTFNSPCNTPEAGVWIWDVHNRNNVEFVDIIVSEAGDRTNDVKVATMNSGDILVMSNESCAGGDGGFEIYDVNHPSNPQKLASVTIDELNPISNALFGGITDVGVHNLFLFTQGSHDYVGVVAETAFDNFQIYDITDPTNPTLVTAWGAEELFDPGVGDEVVDVGRVLNAALWLLDGFGAFTNRFLHDITVTADGNHVYLANWDAGLVLLDISDPATPQLVSVALDPTSEDGEVNSHSVWPSEDGSIVIEGEEDFSTQSLSFTIDSGSYAGSYPTMEANFTTPIDSLPGMAFSGTPTYVGLACSPIPSGSGIALIQRGACRFDLKAVNAINAGYSAMVVFNDVARGDAVLTMGGDPTLITGTFPAVFVGHYTGLKIMNVASEAGLVIGATGDQVTAAVTIDGWSGFRVWDYSNPANPVLASTFNTLCSATVIHSSCDPAGTYSSHNVIVESTDDGRVKAYIAWYSDGMLILDITDPYNPVETARYTAAGESYWGVYKVPEQPWIYGSNRNGGLAIFKEYGSGN